MQITGDAEQSIHSVHYLPAINQSPTKLETIQEMLNLVKAKAVKLNLNCTDLVLDHAIYSKALKVINNPENANMRDAINLQIGALHECGIFLAVIGERFASAGLRDLIIEVGLAGSDSTEIILKGKHYKRGVRIGKYVYEALQRIKLEMFEKWLQDQGKAHLLFDFLESDIFSKLLKERKPEYLNERIPQNSSVFLLHLMNLTSKLEVENLVQWRPFDKVTLTWYKSY